ncbi:putative protein kinase RLK-Pelle-LRR-III family [Helianthus annuus]|nr:putative protein kinase RLK-Pelle-LRR-III family [Helianthus annuus]
MSRLMHARVNSHHIATDKTLGYQAPEVSKLKEVDMKADVYSFGMIMLELLTRKSPEDPWNGLDLPQWVALIVKEEKTKEVFDRDLMKDASAVGESELLDSLKLALQCIPQSPQDRPDVQLVLQRLEEIRPETTTNFGDDGVLGPSLS